MSILKYFGSAVLALGVSYVTLQAVTSGAASGDAVYIKKAGAVVLSAGQKSTAATCFGQTISGYVPANVQRVYLSRDTDGLWARVCDKYLPTAAEVVALDLGGQTGADLGGGYYERCSGRVQVNATARACWAGLVASVHPAVSIDTLIDYTIWRDPVVTTTVSAEANYLVSASPATYVSDKASGNVVKILDQVR